jgi:hypothetical protein
MQTSFGYVSRLSVRPLGNISDSGGGRDGHMLQVLPYEDFKGHWPFEADSQKHDKASV